MCKCKNLRVPSSSPASAPPRRRRRRRCRHFCTFANLTCSKQASKGKGSSIAGAAAVATAAWLSVGLSGGNNIFEQYIRFTGWNFNSSVPWNKRKRKRYHRSIDPSIHPSIMSSSAPSKSLTQTTLAVSNKGNKLVYASGKSAKAKQGWLRRSYV